VNVPIGQLPVDAAKTVLNARLCEVATLSRQGLPIDTQLICAVEPGRSFIPVSTGLAYPVKAERARRQPKVGLLFEAPENGPVVSMAAVAAVRDADIYANALRYVTSFPDMIDRLGHGRPWSELRQAYWYWARIFIECTPVSIDWWPSWSDLAEPPRHWVPDSAVEAPVSDPNPPGVSEPGSGWEAIADWRKRADEVTKTMRPPHLTVTDGDGYPRPIRTSGATPFGDGFEIDVASGVPWLPAAGPATLSYDGRATFVGQLSGRRFAVERMLPDLPLVVNPDFIFDPPPEVRDPLLRRIHHELDRRGQPAPILPEIRPS
jgi:hypothetical protein